MADTYFVINNSEGDTYVRQYTKDQLLKWLHEDWEGVRPEFLPRFLDELAREDTNYWAERNYLIIKGQIVKPEPKEKVVEYDIV